MRFTEGSKTDLAKETNWQVSYKSPTQRKARVKCSVNFLVSLLASVTLRQTDSEQSDWTGRGAVSVELACAALFAQADQTMQG